MSAQIIDGKKIAAEVNEESRKEISALARDFNLQPGLAVVLIGEDPASQVYVNMKDRKCQELGIYSAKHVLDKDATMEEVLKLIDQLNHDSKINGILVQSPPPPQIDEEKVIAAMRREEMMNDSARVALVTGASRRIGADIVRHLHLAGYRVVLHFNRSAEEAEVLAANFDPKSTAGLGSKSEIEAFVHYIRAQKAGNAGDLDTFKSEILEAVWKAPKQAQVFLQSIETRRRAAEMEKIQFHGTLMQRKN